MSDQISEISQGQQENIPPVKTRAEVKQPEKQLPKAFIGSEFQKMKDHQKEAGKQFSVLFTDIDNTFYRSNRSDASQKIADGAYEAGYPIVAVTGNDYGVVIKRIESGELPYFQVIAGSVGTEMWVLHEDSDGTKSYIKDEEFATQLHGSGYERKPLSSLGKKMVEDLSLEMPDLKIDFQNPDLEQQFLDGELVQVQPFKMSFYFYADNPFQINAIYTQVQNRFPRQKGVICEEIGYNSQLPQGDNKKKYCLDILPVTKADVVKHIIEVGGVEFAVVAGDSGNDTEMLTGSGDVSILVGGAKPEAKEAIDSLTDSQSGFSKVGDKKLYYKEKDNTNRLGPESIIKVVRTLQRLERRFRNQSTSQDMED